MYLDEPSETENLPMPRNLSIVAAISALAMLLFFLYPMPLIKASQTASTALLQDIPHQQKQHEADDHE